MFHRNAMSVLKNGKKNLFPSPLGKQAKIIFNNRP
jgi:hypothetical protein